MEQWAIIKGYEHYEVSNLGNVRRVVPNARGWTGPLKATKTTAGYPTVKLVAAPSTPAKTHYNHHLVAKYFLPAPSDGQTEIAHNDGDSSNPAASNLRWASHKENEQDKNAHGTLRRGEDHPHSRLTIDIVRQIRSAVGSQSSIAASFGITREHARDIRSGKRWGWAA